MKAQYKRRSIQGRKIDEHRLVMEAAVGRRLGRFEFVHHVDGNKFNNKLENLKLVTPREHAQEHGQQKHPLTWICAYCGAEFIPPANKRGGIKKTCSKSCRYKRQSLIFRRPDAPRSRHSSTEKEN